MYRKIKQQLMGGGMDAGEARAVTLLIMEKVCGMDTASALLAPCDWGKADGEHAAEARRLREAVDKIVGGEPVQYALGEADFCGHAFHVEKGVLIPRVETEELVEWVAQEEKAAHEEQATGEEQTALEEQAGHDASEKSHRQEERRLLDIGTGSGCIAVTLASLLPQAKVEAWDVSEAALCIAEGNAKRMRADVCFRKVDVLTEGMAEAEKRAGLYDAIVSNPPYICREEAAEMEANVLDHEPEVALFVPDDDPLLFYRQIASMALVMLKSGGRLFFEINRRFGADTVEMLRGMGYDDVELRQDQFGNDRMVMATKVMNIALASGR